jgi:hypothetical protein
VFVFVGKSVGDVVQKVRIFDAKFGNGFIGLFGFVALS